MNVIRLNKTRDDRLAMVLSGQVQDTLTEVTEPDGSVWVTTGVSWAQTKEAGASLANVSTAITGIVNEYEILNPVSGTRQTKYFVGATAISGMFRDYGSGVAKEAIIVFNAVDDADADAKSLIPQTRSVVPIGTEFTKQFSSSNKCVRVDVYSNVASETGATKLILQGVSP